MASYETVQQALSRLFLFKNQTVTTPTVDAWFHLLRGVPEEIWPDFWANLTVRGIPEECDVVVALRGLDLETDWAAIVQTATAKSAYQAEISREAYEAVLTLGGIVYLGTISSYDLSKAKDRFLKLATPTKLKKYRHPIEVEKVTIYSPYSQLSRNKVIDSSEVMPSAKADESLSIEGRQLLQDKIAGMLGRDLDRKIKNMNQLFYEEGAEG